MATKKAGGSTRNGRDSSGKRLGLKKFGNQFVKPGNIILKQKGTKFLAGLNVSIGKDHTLFASNYGRIFFKKIKRQRTIVIVI